MKKILIFILTITFSFASNITTLKEKIIENISDIFVNKKIIKIYIDDSNFNDIFKNSTKFKKIVKINNADIILTKDSSQLKDIKSPTCIISTSYRDYNNYTHVDCGAFFWQKGRPNLIFNASIIKQRKIKIPKQYIKYIE